jgi:arylsulfatase
MIRSLTTTLLLLASVAVAKQPNIIVILSDDMGYTDVGCYGGEINTPNLDALACKGLRFTQFYNTGRCCPTRASLLTGLYPHQAGMGHMTFDRGADGYRGDLNKQCATIAEVLGSAGYSTYCVGKWHLTKAIRTNTHADKYNWPLQRGFDRYYGIITGASSFWDPNVLVRGNTMVTPASDKQYQPAGTFHLTDAFSDNAVAFIEEHDDSKPFFLYLAYTAPHWPMHARERDVDRYNGVYDEGYGAIRKARLEKAKRMGVVDPDAQLPPAPPKARWETVVNKEWNIR